MKENFKNSQVLQSLENENEDPSEAQEANDKIGLQDELMVLKMTPEE